MDEEERRRKQTWGFGFPVFVVEFSRTLCLFRFYISIFYSPDMVAQKQEQKNVQREKTRSALQ